MADIDASGWWNVGEAPSLTEWCEKNVAGACEALAGSVRIWDWNEEYSGDINVQIWCDVLEESIGEPTSIKALLTSYADSHVNIHYAKARGIPPVMGSEAVRTLKDVRDHIDALLSEYAEEPHP
jgi:hypothetical protein